MKYMNNHYGMSRTFGNARCKMPMTLQFFAEGDMIELTPELKALFDDWVNLTAEQKDAGCHMIKTMRHG